MSKIKKMEILFLGTSAGWPLPRLGCDCEICSSKNPKDTRWRPVILINQTVLVDCGPDIYHQLIKQNIKIPKLKALILTHAHPDHLLGFYDLTHLYNRAPELKLYATQNTINGLKQSHRYPLHPFKQEAVKSNEVFEINQIKFSLISVRHNHFPTWGVKMKQRRLVAYLPDFKRIPKNQRKTWRGADLLILDGSSLGKAGQTRTHQSILEGIELAKNLKAKQVYFTHLGHKTDKHQELEKIIQKEGGKNFQIAFDGLRLTA